MGVFITVAGYGFVKSADRRSIERPHQHGFLPTAIAPRNRVACGPDAGNQPVMGGLPGAESDAVAAARGARRTPAAAASRAPAPLLPRSRVLSSNPDRDRLSEASDQEPGGLPPAPAPDARALLREQSGPPGEEPPAGHDARRRRLHVGDQRHPDQGAEDEPRGLVVERVVPAGSRVVEYRSGSDGWR